MHNQNKKVSIWSLHCMVLLLISGCKLSFLGPEPPAINYEWDNRLKGAQWVLKGDSFSKNEWFFMLQNQCDDIEYCYFHSSSYNPSYEKHLYDSIQSGYNATIHIRWYTSGNAILHTDAVCSYSNMGGPIPPESHVLRDWHYSFRNDTILVIDSVEYVREVIDIVQQKN